MSLKTPDVGVQRVVLMLAERRLLDGGLVGTIASLSGGRLQQGSARAPSPQEEAGRGGGVRGGEGWLADGWNAQGIRRRMQGPGAPKQHTPPNSPTYMEKRTNYAKKETYNRRESVLHAPELCRTYHRKPK